MRVPRAGPGLSETDGSVPVYTRAQNGSGTVSSPSVNALLDKELS